MPPGWLPPKSCGGRRRSRVLLSCRKRHKMGEEDEEEEELDDCPVGKKRMKEAGVEQEWTLPASQVAAQPCPAQILCEEMEQAVGEQLGDAMHRRLQEIEDRIIDDDDDDVLAEGSVSRVPTLVLSDTLKTGLKRDYQEVLTKKIIESMSRPSMELVLWKPLPEFLTDRAKSVSVKNYKLMETERELVKAAALEAAFHPQTFPEQHQPADLPSAPLCGTEGPSGGIEEEMEL
ncbi:coiled-coil domain-containing protein 117 [Varanus komodoensis]|uniref:coiled-coil domain-containing protein 117 n=1 Tax=Varanus komodoensis TaxID=61221 RepID=UPI001CF79CB4|nr:coiled-coil domain-containing protein 117 [Varanus komodoensis]